MSFLRKIIDTLIYSNIFIGLCAVALALTNQLLVDENIYFDKSLWFVFFSTVFTYSFLKLRNPDVSSERTVHQKWANENRVLSQIIILISFIATVFFFFQLRRAQQFIVVLLAAFTALYDFANIPFITPQKTFRDFGNLKTIFVAVVWSVTTVAVPLAEVHIGLQILIFLLLRRFLFILALTVPFEIKDITYDRAHRLQTLPITFGIEKTKLIAQVILFVLTLILIIQYFLFNLSLANMLAVNTSLLVSIFCIRAVNEETKEWWYYIVLDGMMVLQFVFVYIASIYFE